MKTPINDGGPDFPSQQRSQHANHAAGPLNIGLSRRELFAAMAMQGMLSDPNVNDPADGIAMSSVMCADALIAELSKPAKPKVQHAFNCAQNFGCRGCTCGAELERSAK